VLDRDKTKKIAFINGTEAQSILVHARWIVRVEVGFGFHRHYLTKRSGKQEPIV